MVMENVHEFLVEVFVAFVVVGWGKATQRFEWFGVPNPGRGHAGSFRDLAVSRSLLGRVLNVLKGTVGPDLSAGTLAQLRRHVLGVKNNVLKANHDKGKVGVSPILGVPIVPQMSQGIVMILPSIVFDREWHVVTPLLLLLSFRVGQVWAPVVGVVGPFGRVGVFAHASHPVVGVSDGNDG